MTKRKTKTAKRKTKRKSKPDLLGVSIFWNGNTYIVTKEDTVHDNLLEKLELTAVRYKPIEF